jgi:hypothetical protein
LCDKWVVNLENSENRDAVRFVAHRRSEGCKAQSGTWTEDILYLKGTAEHLAPVLPENLYVETTDINECREEEKRRL